MRLDISRAQIQDIEDQLRGVNQRPPPFPSAHHFANGVYARETVLPRESVVTGKIHRYECINVLTMGQVLVANPEQPEQNKLLVAPYVFVSPAGSKRLVMALQDSIWMTFHPAETQDLGELEEQLIVKTYDELSIEERECLGLR